MAVFSRVHIENSASELLKKVGIYSIPVNLESITNHLGLNVVRKDFSSDGLSAVLFRKERKVAINSIHGKERQRFSLAHEIGHYVLHENQNDFIDPVFKRENMVLQKNKSTEMEANQFAAALLMPEIFLKKSIQNIDTKDSDWMAKLAGEYRVSMQAMSFRLLNLGYLETHE